MNRTLTPKLLLLVAALIVLAGCSTPGNTPPGQQVAQTDATSTPFPTAPAVSRPTYLVQRGDVQEILEFTGRWQSRDQTALSFDIPGTIRRVNVQRGDTVNSGDLLADYEITDLEGQLAQLELDLQAAQADLVSGAEGEVQSVEQAQISLANANLRLESAKGSSPWTGVASARVSVDEAETNLENAQRAYDDARSRADNNAQSVIQAYEALQSAQTRLRSAQISYDQAAQQFNDYQYTIAEAENAVIDAELALQRAQSGGGTDPNEQRSLLSTQLSIDQVKADIARSSLYAPIDGEVLEVNIQPGDQVNAFDVVIRIGLPEPKEAIANLPIGDAQDLSVGLVGTCQVINQPESAVQCVVRQIPLNAQEADQTTRVAASLDNVTTNQIIEVQMPLQVREGVLWLPPVAIRTFQNRTFVVLQTPDGPRSVDVQIGLRTDERVEIISGVEEGDVVEGP